MNLYGRERKVVRDALMGDKYMLKAIPQNSVTHFLDIGANVGLVSILAKLLHWDMCIYAVEPHQETYDRLVENVSNMKVKTLNYAYGDGSIFTTNRHRKTSLCNSYHNKAVSDRLFRPRRGAQHACCKSMGLSEMVERFNIDPDDLIIKMDCEGGEHYLKTDYGSYDILMKVKYMSIEVHQMDEEEMTIKGFLDWCINTLSNSHDIEYDSRDGEHSALIKMRKL